MFGATGNDHKSVRSKTTVASEESKLKEKFGFDIKVSKNVGSVQDMQVGLPPSAVKTYSTRKGDSIHFEGSMSDLMTDEGDLSHLDEHSSFVEPHEEMNQISNNQNIFDPSKDIASSNSLDDGTLASLDMAAVTQAENTESAHFPPVVADADTTVERAQTMEITTQNIEKGVSEEVSPSTKASKFKTRIKTIIEDGKASSKQEKKQWKGTIGEIGRKAKKVEKDKKIVFTKRRSTEMPVIIDEDSDDYLRMLSMNVAGDAPTSNEQSSSATTAPLENAAVTNSSSFSNTGGENTIHATSSFPQGVDLQGTAASSDALNSATSTHPISTTNTLAATGTTNSEAELLTASASPTTEKPKPNVKGGRLRNKFKFKPLPLVPCIEFKGLGGKAKRNVTLMQVFATLFQVVKYSFANRSMAFKMKVMEEVSDIIQVCQEMPSERDHDYSNNLDEDNDQSMQLSASQPIHQRALNDDDDMTIDTLTGQIIETISEMSIPAVHEGGPINDAPPVVNLGVRAETDIVNMDSNGFLIIPIDKSIVVSKKNTKDNMEDATYGDTNVAIFDGGKKEPTFVRNFYNRPKPSTGSNSGDHGKAADDKNKNKNSSNNRVINQEVMNELGLFEFEARYVSRPHDDIVVAVAIVSSHSELEKREQQVALSWLDIWDDGTFEYKMLKKKGLDLSGF
eukprot:gene25881-34473_t